MRTWVAAALFLLCASVLASPAFADQSKADVQDRIQAAADVFNEIMNVPEKGIPEELLERADCVMVVPSMIKGGFIVGGRYGRGVVTCRRGSQWSAPAMFRVAGGSFGAQIGAEAVDLVMLVMNKRGEQFLYKDKFTIGGDVSGAAGPIGRDASAQTNARMNSEILTWSRSKGLFAGATLNGASVRPDKDADALLYGNDVGTRQILSGSVRTPAIARPLVAAVSRHAREVAETPSRSRRDMERDADTDRIAQDQMQNDQPNPGSSDTGRSTADTMNNDAHRAGHAVEDTGRDVGHGAVEGGRDVGRGVGNAASDANSDIHDRDGSADQGRDSDQSSASDRNERGGKQDRSHYRVEADRLQAAADVFNSLSNAPDSGIPRDLIDRASCIVVIPSMKKAGFGIGGRYGKGAVSCREGNGFSAPAMVELEGGSFGWQIGGEAVDLVMLVMNKRGQDFLFHDKVTLGGDVSAAAGPVGREASAQTNATLKSEILTYSRAKGAFAGISLNGASLRPDKGADRALYGKDVTTREILSGNVTPPPPAQAFIAALESRTNPSGVNVRR